MHGICIRVRIFYLIELSGSEYDTAAKTTLPFRGQALSRFVASLLQGLSTLVPPAGVSHVFSARAVPLYRIAVEGDDSNGNSMS